jgi:hypothetical protein
MLASDFRSDVKQNHFKKIYPVKTPRAHRNPEIPFHPPFEKGGKRGI